jgi:outer membrane protein OmpA-like peptidoglycan-associated protein
VKTFIAAAVAAALLCACAAPPKPATTTVILLPDEDGHVGSVSVSSGGGTRQLSEAFGASTVVGSNGTPSGVNALGETSVSADYANLLKAQPPKPVSFILYFNLDRTTLTDESKAMLSQVIDAARQRKPTEITIFGHTDSTGSEKHNMKLSQDRANAVARMLQKEDPSFDRIQLQYFGDNKPLIQSGSKAEPRNRRAEVQIL